MTPQQYYFPYFLDLKSFNKTIAPLGLVASITYNTTANLPDKLILSKYKVFKFIKTPFLSLPFHTLLMIKQSQLIFWLIKENILTVNIVDTNTGQIQEYKIDVSGLNFGRNPLNEEINLGGFVTYVRRDGIKYNQDWCERFAILIINKGQTELTPFDWFNKKGGDFGYVWPALAKVDFAENKLYGQGMRMADFTLDMTTNNVTSATSY